MGGTPVQNVGAYGQEVASVIDRVRAFDAQTREFVEFTNAECGFAYRRSRFNTTDRGRYIVARVDYRLKPGGAPTLRYAELKRAFAASREAGIEPDLAQAATMVRRIRRSKGMLRVVGDADARSAGSFFKNPVIGKELFEKIAARAKNTPPGFAVGKGADGEVCVKIYAAWLIEQTGFVKGYTMGAAGISTKHTLALVNLGSAKATEILALAEKISADVEERFGVRLEMEPE
ncbi:MAG: UDP-N-acetylenolpyruvoylglucosamine reductase, partial [Terracidiphilus sp.]